MALRDQFDSDLATFFGVDEFAITVTYIDENDTEYITQAIFDDLESHKIQAGSKANYAEVILKTSVLPTIQNQHRIVIDGNTWRVEEKAIEQEGVALLTIRREEARVF